NTCPARFVFVRTPEAKARLLPARTRGNGDKTKQAPVTAIIGYDTRFFEWMPKKLFSHRPEMADNYAKNAALTEVVAFRNGTLQGAYFMLAARAIGLDVGGMSGFDNAQGRAEPSKVMAKLPAWTATKPARCSDRPEDVVRRRSASRDTARGGRAARERERGGGGHSLHDGTARAGA